MVEEEKTQHTSNSANTIHDLLAQIAIINDFHPDVDAHVGGSAIRVLGRLVVDTPESVAKSVSHMSRVKRTTKKNAEKEEEEEEDEDEDEE